MTDQGAGSWPRRVWQRVWRASRRDVEILKRDAGYLRRDLGALRQLVAEKADLAREVNALRAEMLRQRRMLRGPMERPGDRAVAVRPPRSAASLNAAVELLRREVPAAVAAWERARQNSRAAYATDPRGSCSVAGNDLAELFADFVHPYLGGSILDVGCGVQTEPIYLRGVPSAQIAGLDPELADPPHPFTFAQGLAESIPWPDDAFDVVIAASSLDHVVLVDRVLAEVDRVLRPGGTFLLWVAIVPGAPRYDPYAAVVEAVDPYHLFHFDTPWLEALLAGTFAVRERVAFSSPVHSVFYALTGGSRDGASSAATASRGAG